jgi:ribosomal protein S18 acetylase RimI-like enzyme
MTIDIRDADLDDPAHAAAIVAILSSYASSEFGGGVPLGDAVLAGLVPGLRAHPTTLVLLAFVAGSPVGMAVCFLGFSTFAARPLLNVHDLAVLPDHRGQGIGRALLAAVEARGRARGCCKLTLEVLEDNQRARGLYTSVGFADVALGSSTATRFLSKPLAAT